MSHNKRSTPAATPDTAARGVMTALQRRVDGQRDDIVRLNEQLRDVRRRNDRLTDAQLQEKARADQLAGELSRACVEVARLKEALEFMTRGYNAASGLLQQRDDECRALRARPWWRRVLSC